MTSRSWLFVLVEAVAGRKAWLFMVEVMVLI